MAAKITIVSSDLVWRPEPVERLWFFPDGSQYLRYSPHFHAIWSGGFRQNFPLTHMFVVIHEGKLSVKNYTGYTYERIHVRDQVWFVRGTIRKAQGVYAQLLPGRKAYARSGR